MEEMTKHPNIRHNTITLAQHLKGDNFHTVWEELVNVNLMVIQRFQKKIRGWKVITDIKVFEIDSNLTRRRRSDNRNFHLNQYPIVKLKPIATLKTLPLRNRRQNSDKRFHEELLKKEKSKQTKHEEKGRKR